LFWYIEELFVWFKAFKYLLVSLILFSILGKIMDTELWVSTSVTLFFIEKFLGFFNV